MATKDTSGVLAVPNLEKPQEGLNFRTISTGLAVPVTKQTDIYPLIKQKADLLTLSLDYTDQPKTAKVIRTIGTFKLYEREGPPEFFNTSHLEVLPIFPAYVKYNYTTFFGNWFDVCTGTGFFMPVGITLMAYNGVHLLNMLGLKEDKIFLYGSTEFKKQVVNAAGVVPLLSMSFQQYSDGKYNYFNNETTPMKYVSWMALQKGYKTIQMSNEWDGKSRRRYFVDLLDPNISNRNLTRRNPFAIQANPKSRHWYHYLFCVAKGVEEKYIVDIGSNRSFYEMVPFQRECRLAGGMINIYNKYLQCLKIVKFGMKPEILQTETTVDYTKYPQSTELEKLQSYFTIVYGDAEMWKTQTLDQLRQRWNVGEVCYNDLYNGLKMTNVFPGDNSKGRFQSYYYNLNDQNTTVTANPTIRAFLYKSKPAEQLKYIEVFRNGTRSSTVEDNVNFAGTYYYACRGSGFFLPVEGPLFYSLKKNDLLAAKGVPLVTEVTWEQDKPISSTAISNGVEVFSCTAFMGYSGEIIHSVDVITSLSQVIRMSPFDKRVSQVCEQVFQDPYVKAGVTGPVIKKQFNNLTP